MALTSIVDRWNVPGYNYFFEIGALLFLFILLIKYFYHKRFPTIITKLFISALVVAIADIAVDITASVLVESYIHECPIWLNELFNGLFYVLQVGLPCLMFVYLLAMLGTKFNKNKTLLKNNKKARPFVESMRNLFKSLDYPIVIEGVETKEQYEFAKKLDFEYIQGYYFAKCLTEEEYLAFLQEHK